MSDPKIIDWKARAEQAEAERDALAAHNVKLRELAEFWINRAAPGPKPSKEEYDSWLALGHHNHALTQEPITYLARRDAEVAAHTAQQIQWNVAADCIGHETLKPSVVLGWLSDYAVKYHRQAEGEDQ